MCGLCGIFGETAHWSTAGVAQGGSRRQRLFRVNAANDVLRLVRLQLRDFSGTDYVLSGPTGGQAMVKELGQLWQSVETMLGWPLDPLDETLMAAYRQRETMQQKTVCD